MNAKRPLSLVLMAAVGCGKGDAQRPVTTDASTVKQAQATADAMEMARYAMWGYELPVDGGPLVLYGVEECVPGSKHGPCVDNSCGHKLCGEARVLAAKTCPLCKKPLGFGARVHGPLAGRLILTEANCDRAFHVACWDSGRGDPNGLILDCGRCGGKFNWPSGDVMNGERVHRKRECDNWIRDFGGPRR